MPRFHFDLFMGTHGNLDEEGHEVVSLRAAELQALRSAGELARDRLLMGQEINSEDIRVEVRNEHRWPVLAVTISIRVERVGECSALDTSRLASPVRP
ncbi:DUF6894 family protein [Microvirga yunnanensis]|uniref:DUF6894 family protein n=1 Tax=Microvirga yunnanensis TaxID=2953740 RepID=UPI0021C69855|nr:hypothetical protein [Microvirga sp. HBU65207]